MSTFLVILCLTVVASNRLSLADDLFSPENVKEVSCAEEYVPAPNRNITWVRDHASSTWYYLMGNRAHGRIIKQVLTGQVPKGPQDFKNSCLTIRRTDKGFIQSGFKTHADFKCRLENEYGLPSRTCLPDPESKETVLEWAAIRGTTEATIVWTDCHYEIGFRCSGGTTVWSLRSTDPKPVTADVRKTILDFIVSKGFHLDHLIEFPQEEGCDYLSDNHLGRSIQAPTKNGGDDSWLTLD